MPMNEFGEIVRPETISTMSSQSPQNNNNDNNKNYKGIIVILVLVIVGMSLYNYYGSKNAGRSQAQNANESIQYEDVQEVDDYTETENYTSADRTDTPTLTQTLTSTPIPTPTPTPFWGVWCYASRDENEAQKVADGLISIGIEGRVFLSSEWSNLNQENWYCASASIYPTESEAERVLSVVQDAGYTDAYIKYSGSYIG